LKTELLSAAFTKLAIGVVTGITLGGGAAIVSAASTNAVQDQRLSVLERNAEKMDELSTKLDETNKNVAVLNARLTAEAAPR
jgi:tRNA(Phe) wybutosine-synthesizing methylase Tyw3